MSSPNKAENKRVIEHIASDPKGIYLSSWAFLKTCLKHPLTAPAMAVGTLYIGFWIWQFSSSTVVSAIAPAPIPGTAPMTHRLGNGFGRVINTSAGAVRPALKPVLVEYYQGVNGYGSVPQQQQPTETSIPGLTQVSTMGLTSQPATSGLSKAQMEAIDQAIQP